MRLLAQPLPEKRKVLIANKFAPILLTLFCMDTLENDKRRFLLCPKVAHSERRGEAVAMNIYGEQDIKVCEAGVARTHIREVYSYKWTEEIV